MKTALLPLAALAAVTLGLSTAFAAPAGPLKLAVTVPPGIAVNVPFSVDVAITDAFGNVINTSSDRIFMSVNGVGVGNRTTVAGRVTFTNLRASSTPVRIVCSCTARFLTKTVTVQAGVPSSITSNNSTTFTEGTSGSFPVTATGTPSPALSMAAAPGSSVPSGVSFTDDGGGSGTLSGTPGAGTTGTYSLTITASNGVGPSAVQTFTLVVGVGRLYVSEFTNSQVLSFSGATGIDGDLPPTTALDVGVSQDQIALDVPRNMLYVSSFDDTTVRVHHSANTVTGATPPTRTLQGLPGSTRGVLIDSANDRLYVTCGDSLLVFDGASNLNGPVTPDRSITGFPGPFLIGLALDSAADRLFVSDFLGSRIAVFDAISTKNGPYASTVDREIMDSLSRPQGLFVDVANQRLYVADTAFQYIAVYDSCGTIGALDPPSRVVTGLTFPVSVFVDVTRNELWAGDGDISPGGMQGSIRVYAGADTVSGAATPSRVVTGPRTTLSWRSPRTLLIDFTRN